jgi:hypothetical protein
LGMWGYLQCMEEIREQIAGLGITDIVMVSPAGSHDEGAAMVDMAGSHNEGLPRWR